MVTIKEVLNKQLPNSYEVRINQLRHSMPLLIRRCLFDWYKTLTKYLCAAKTRHPGFFSIFSLKTVPFSNAFSRKIVGNSAATDVFSMNGGVGSGSKKKIYISFVTIVLLLLAFSTSASSLSQGYYTSDDMLKPGMVVALSTMSSTDIPQVERATREMTDKVLGVATNTDDTLVTVASGEQQVFVQAHGTVEAFVSDINGTIQKGDKLALSPLRGVLMRGDDSLPALGTALGELAGNSANSQLVSFNGEQVATNVDKITIALDTSLASKSNKDAESTLQRLGRSVTGRQVGEFQVIVALIIFLVVLISEGSIIYGAITSGIISVGRNPMAKRAIKGEMLRVFGVASFVLLVGLSAVYIILRI